MTTAEANLHATDYLLRAARYRFLRERLLCRPCVILQPELSERVDAVTYERQWVAEYYGVFATGDTPEEAYEAFDRAWQGRAA